MYILTYKLPVLIHIQIHLLKRINESSKNDADLIRFQIRTVTDEGEEVEYHEEEFEGINGVEAFKRITK